MDSIEEYTEDKYLQTMTIYSFLYNGFVSLFCCKTREYPTFY